jgi:hypothetical protein
MYRKSANQIIHQADNMQVPICAVFYLPFSQEGQLAAETSTTTGLLMQV